MNTEYVIQHKNMQCQWKDLPQSTMVAIPEPDADEATVIKQFEDWLEDFVESKSAFNNFRLIKRTDEVVHQWVIKRTLASQEVACSS